MERILLSLKTIYKMLMSNDYPVYSDSVIPEKMRKGQTLLRFWQSMTAEEFCSGPCGRVIWKNDGKRSRYLSGLCNRSTEHRLYREYSRELAAQCSEETLLKQIAVFSEFLSLREFRYEILMRRVTEVVRIWETDDRLIPAGVLQLIRESARPEAVPSESDKQGRLFQSGYLLTLMMIFASSGESMDEPGLSVLLEERFSLAELWKARKRVSDSKKSVEFLTVHSGILQDSPLPRHRFFGREEALFDLRELALAQKKCLISGIGGIGKTELLRQLLRLTEEERLADKLAVVPYGNGLAESFVRAFSERKQIETEEAFRSILAGIHRDVRSGIRVLILVDDLDKGAGEDPDLLELQNLPCGVVITSRRTSLEGFETYSLEAPSVTTGTLIFRDSYGRPMTREDRDMLKQMLRSEDICHPLTLNLMARAAGSRGWSVSQLMQQLKTEGTDLIWVEKDRTLRTSQIYNRLYSMMKVPDSCRLIAQLFTLLPSESYSETYLAELFPGLVGEDFPEKLRLLAAGGWLDDVRDGYAMHPLIAECLRRKVITEDRMQPMLECLHRRLPALRPVRCELGLTPEETLRVARILMNLARFLSGSISSGLMLDLLNAANLHSFPKAVQKTVFDQLSHWRRHCRQWNDLLQVTWCTVVAGWDLADPGECEKIFTAQRQYLTVPKQLYLDFCLRVGESMTNAHQTQLSRDMLLEVLCDEASPSQKAMAYCHLSGYCHVLGKPEEAMEWSRQGVEYVRKHPECGILARIDNLHMLCSMYTQYRKKEQAWELLREMEPLIAGSDRPDLKSQYLDILGLLEMTFGNPEKALTCMCESLELYEELFGRERNYYQKINMLGNTYIRLNMLEKAEEAYNISIGYARRVGDRRMLQSASNNISVALLKMQRPKDALVHLETAVAEGRKIGGLMFGESLRNTAIAWGQLGDEGKELAFYEAAWPLLLEAYGPDHPRTMDAEKRMDILKSK